jgi:hypothetical protein
MKVQMHIVAAASPIHIHEASHSHKGGRHDFFSKHQEQARYLLQVHEIGFFYFRLLVAVCGTTLCPWHAIRALDRSYPGNLLHSVLVCTHLCLR